ncbi:hypothetical protein LSTR_LSTR011096 [Laodelphax striatellus]|uniref:Small integral membrane protein 13 n=1 Tax=Laodelphax striatellus TaxID=195883 RepID=A0A482XIV6_LAOST|nr:hypothetical protein LSTR_LSTR011096 [Laodelphax striatellus]
MELLLALVSIISSVVLVFLLVALGWFLVWKIFLSHFRFVRELLGGGTVDSGGSQVAAGEKSTRTLTRLKKLRRE